MLDRPNTLLFALAASCLILPSAATGEGIPKVLLSEQHKAMCKVGVGDKLPGGVELGKQATVVAFVNRDGWMTRQLLKDLPLDVQQPFGEAGVGLQVVLTGDGAPAAGKAPAVDDADGKLFAAVGSGATPRVYVMDGAGKIVWFDIEYVRSTRRELRQTLEALTAK
ncbi:MAG: hypothetical protein AAGG46_11985 [Planctomycetota bacterium]